MPSASLGTLARRGGHRQCRELILIWEAPMRPNRSVFAGSKIVEIGEQTIAQLGRLLESEDLFLGICSNLPLQA
jgi:hypothetical protein